MLLGGNAVMGKLAVTLENEKISAISANRRDKISTSINQLLSSTMRMR
jgi:hypothetical protein